MIGRLYYQFFFYKRQGIPATSFPLPVIGSLNKLVQAKKRESELSCTVLEECWFEGFRGQPSLPPIIQFFMGPEPVLIINDPEVVNELYVAKNKFVDKSEKFHRMVKKLFGDSILFTQSDDKWAVKRKHLSSAFYKDKLQGMLALIISVTNQHV
jgi:cytochrome P450